jgi:hypothetical protein
MLVGTSTLRDELLQGSDYKFIARGLGRSYGDSSLNSENFQVTVNSKKFIDLDEQSGVVHVSANI